tara:strand:- start:245 stop:793 length:549 start_codon:yes stop_codon:yes gene_type:complete
MRVSIHQPNFVPWYPFFQKIKEVDVFVILKECQFEKNGYQNRFNFNDKWYTMSVKKGLESMRDKVYIDPKNNWDKIKNSLPKYKSILNEMDKCIVENLTTTNFCIISNFCEMLDIDTELKVDQPTDLVSTERLLDICKSWGATEYLSGIGGKDYLDVKLFNDNGIKVVFQEDMDRRHTLELL